MDEEVVERLVGEVADMRGHIDQGIESLRTEVREGLSESRRHSEALTQELRGEMREGLAEVRRHSDVIAEGLRSEIQLVAEGVSSVRSDLQQFRTEVDQRFTEAESRNRLAYTDLDRRLQAVEKK